MISKFSLPNYPRITANKLNIVKKPLYILSDTKVLTKDSNIVFLKESNNYYTPVFTSKISISFVKHQSRHSYNIVQTDKETLSSLLPQDVILRYYNGRGLIDTNSQDFNMVSSEV